MHKVYEVQKQAKVIYDAIGQKNTFGAYCLEKGIWEALGAGNIKYLISVVLMWGEIFVNFIEKNR